MFKRLIDFSRSDLHPDDQVRGQLLNIMLVGFETIALFIFLMLLATRPFNVIDQNASIYTVTILTITSVAFIYWLNNKWGRVLLAGTSFILLVTVSITLADAPQELVVGRSLFFFVIPIMMASFLLRSYASFIVAAFLSIEHLVLWTNADISAQFSPYGMIGFFVFALITWLAAQSLESALHEAREINRRLDELVEERTRALAAANAELANANERLKELDQLKTKFVSDVTHELRTPISNISIYLEMIENALSQLNRIPQRVKNFLRILRNETARLNDLINDVLDLSRMEQDVKEIEFELIDFNQIVYKIVEANRMKAEAKGLEITFESAKTLPKLLADPRQLEQVCTNLIANAINYTPNGSIKVSTVLKNGEQCVFRVQDTGMGIDDDEIDHLFDRFYRGRQASQSSIPGTGLGLSITKEIIEAHHGSIDVQSEIGVGTVFNVYLPVINSK